MVSNRKFFVSKLWNYILISYICRIKDPEYIQEITAEYLDKRADFRRTGILGENNRRIAKYREWKKQQEQPSKQASATWL